ncbi:D-2-hydroxyacid dehydrogenase [Thioalkalivibrio sp. ALJ24]|uniref:D-2-hydroxyacid dehydrogenase n=1 Tax=Thioalkalivibrio sp. ALJ24 TaxID=545276 RepID=UPI00036AB46E|nr:D-2-hydroxyacid dehydrogenase [Thioalkalivibrio sp. ALJ24]
MNIRRILVLQKAEVLEGQAESIRRHLEHALPDAQAVMAGRPEDVPQGESFDAVIAPTLPWLAPALNRLGGYRWIHFLSAGVEKIWDMPFDRQGVILTRSSGVHGAPMSEYALGAMLHFAKGFDRFVEQSREHRWERAWLDELTGRTVMILGMGHIGEMVARRAGAFDMRIIGVQRRPRASEAAERVVALDEAGDWLGEVDYLVVCLPFTGATRHLVDAGFLARLPAHTVLIDISRGGVVDDGAVVEALDAGRLRGAALDVFEEQPLPPESPLWARPDVLLTPHVSGTSPHYMERALQVFARNARALQAGESPVTPVDPEAGY